MHRYDKKEFLQNTQKIELIFFQMMVFWINLTVLKLQKYFKDNSTQPLEEGFFQKKLSFIAKSLFVLGP